jgi:hypothetical protein
MISTAYAGKIQIPDGTEVQLIFDPNMKISSKNVTEGIPLLVNLYAPIEIGGVVVVEKGAVGTAEVMEVEKAGKAGKPGYIKIKFVDLEPKGDFQPLEDGAKIKLAGEIEKKGKGKKILSWVFIFGLFISGGQGEIDTSLPYTATVTESIILEN